MKSYIFITVEGYTYQPESESIEPDIENCQVIGFAQGSNPKHAFKNLIEENGYLLQTSFDELICLELKHPDYNKYAQYFCLVSYSPKELTKKLQDKYKLIISDIDAGAEASIDLYYHKQTGKVKEQKTLADKTAISIEFSIDEFDPENYGDEGAEFFKKINML